MFGRCAQSLFNLVIVGIGIIVGSKIAGSVAEWATVGEKMDFTKLFSVPMWAGLACLVLMGIFYPHRKPTLASDGPEVEGESAEQDNEPQ